MDGVIAQHHHNTSLCPARGQLYFYRFCLQLNLLDYNLKISHPFLVYNGYFMKTVEMD
jgi:hypothetical protein